MTRTQLKEQVDYLRDNLVQEFNPEKIILFGSAARGKFGPDSDVDLIVVAKSQNTWRERLREARRSVRGRKVPVDIFVYTPQEYREKTEDFSSFWEDVKNKGKVIYEKS